MPQNNFHSEEAQEILGKIPSWTIRWGITVIFLIFLAIILGCCFIKFPEKVNGTITITTANSPIAIVSKSSGNIGKIFVKNNDTVQQGDMLGVIHSNADYKDMLRVESRLQTMSDTTLEKTVFAGWLYKKYNLGEIQSEWASFSSACEKYRDYIKRAVTDKKKKLIREQIDKQKTYYAQMKLQADILSKELEYEKKSYRRDSSLYAKQVVSETEYEESARKLLQARNSVASFESQMTTTELSILQNEQQIIELSMQQDDETLSLRQDIESSRERLTALIENWKLTYLMTASIDGTVSFVRKWDEGQFINAGEQLLTIVPHSGLKAIGIVKVAQDRFGKIRTGQKVNVRLNGYPYMEYGMLTGKVGYISSVPEDATEQYETPQYTAEIIFPDGMKTTYGKELRLIQKMNGTAEIITKDRSLIMRFLDPIAALFKNGI